MATLNQIINARHAAQATGAAFFNLVEINRSCWEGSCEEIFRALEGDDSHEVDVIAGVRVVYRRGYTAPHFVQVGHSFLCPFWGR